MAGTCSNPTFFVPIITVALMMPIRTVVQARKRLCAILFLGLSLSLGAPVSGQQQAIPDVQRDQLLNGLKIVFWPKPDAQNLIIKLRIHSGAMFDLAGKSGEMALLGDLLFPDPGTAEFFNDEMNGKLSVETNYDSITVSMEGRPNEFERIIEILRNALVSTQITADNVSRLRDLRVKIARETSISPAVVANRAIASRLFADFPYGRPASGTPEDLMRLERGDLMLARDRFLNPNNATLVIIGSLDKKRVGRTLRQLLGIWRKSEEIVPATFRPPKPPDVRTLLINGPADQTAEVRVATRGLARSDPDYAAATVLAAIAHQRWQQFAPKLGNRAVFARHEAHLLPGIFVMGASVSADNAGETVTTARNVIDSLMNTTSTAAELDAARREAIGELTNQLMRPDGIADFWLDEDTYHLSADRMREIQSLSAADLQRVANRLFRERALASVILGDVGQLKAALEKQMPIEVIGEISKPQPESKPPKSTTSPKPN